MGDGKLDKTLEFLCIFPGVQAHVTLNLAFRIYIIRTNYMICKAQSKQKLWSSLSKTKQTNTLFSLRTHQSFAFYKNKTKQNKPRKNSAIKGTHKPFPEYTYKRKLGKGRSHWVIMRFLG